MIARFARLRRLSWDQQLLLAEALAMLGLARLAIVALPFRWLTRWLDVAPPRQAPGSAERVRRIGAALHYAAQIASWRSKCLEQAVAGWLMLRRRGLPGTLHLGVAKDGDHMEAHAWLRCGDQIVTGGHELERFGVVARFGGQAS